MRALITIWLLMMCMVAPSIYARDSFSTTTPRFYFGIDLQNTSTDFSKYEVEYENTSGVTQTEIIDNAFDSEGEVSGLAIKFGYHFTNFLGVEVQYVKVQGVELNDGKTFDIDLLASAFLRFDIPFRSVIPYVMAGGSYMNWRYVDPTGTGTIEISNTSTGPAFGGGVEIYGGEHTAFNISWTRYMNDVTSNDGVLTHDALAFGIVHWFEFPSLYRRF